MKYKVEIEQTGMSSKVLSVEANNWFTALREALQALRDAAPLQNINFTVLADGVSAEVTDAGTGRRFLIQADTGDSPQPELVEDIQPVPLEAVEERRTQAYHVGMFEAEDVEPTEVAEDKPEPNEPTREPQATPVVLESQTVVDPQQREERITLAQPVTRPQSFSVQGFYLPGTTDQFLTDAFMKLANLFEHFGHDHKAALRYVLNLVGKGVMFDGAGVLLADINDPMGAASFALTEGMLKDDLSQLQVLLGQGSLRQCSQLLQAHAVDYHEDREARVEDFLPKVVTDVRSGLFAPIQHEGRFLGIVVLFRLAPREGFAAGEVSILEYSGRVLGEYLSAIRELSA